MPTSPIHFGFNTFVYYLVSILFSIEFVLFNLFYLLIAELVDLDHLFSKPIYVKKRNSFKTHFFHKNWKIISIIAILIMFIGVPFIFIGIGILSHFILDYIYTKFILKI